MIVKKQGGMTEFIPSPQEKRDGLICDHTLELFVALSQRVSILEISNGLPSDSAKQFAAMLGRIKQEENQHIKIHNSLLTALNRD